MSNLEVILKPKQDQQKTSQKNAFETYWQKIEKAEKAFQSAERKRAKIVAQFNEELLPFEQDNFTAYYRLTERLLSYLEHKSLSKKLKRETLSWIRINIDKMNHKPFRHQEDDLDQLIYKTYQYERELTEEPTEEEIDELRMFIDETIHNQGFHLDEQSIEDLLQTVIDEGPKAFFDQLHAEVEESIRAQAFDEDNHDEYDNSKPESEPTTKPATESLSRQTINKIYKRLAQRIHPDRAEDDNDRTQRHELMLKLTEAKRNNDVFTILRMMKDHGDTSDEILSDHHLQHFTQDLETKLQDLKDKKRSLKTDDNIEATIFSLFHGKTNKETAQRFTQHRAELSEEIAFLKRLTKEMSSAKKLKILLDERREAMQIIFTHDF